MWQHVFKNKMKAFVQSQSSSVRLMVSPDWDGAVSSVLFKEFMRRTYPHVPCTVLGTYDCEQMTVTAGSSVEGCLFIDLDLPLDGCVHIGQHLIGVPLSNSMSFNPNAFFNNMETWTKYPFGTAQLIYYGLLDEEPPHGPLAEVSLAHADSTHLNCKKYKPNCKKWAARMFPEAEYMERMLDGRYQKDSLESHTALMELVEPFVTHKKKKRKRHEETGGWGRCTKRQTAKDFNDFVHLLSIAAHAFGLEPPTFEGKTEDAAVIWSGRKKVIPLGEAAAEAGLEAYLRKKNAKSHAIVSSHMLSLTLEDLEAANY